MGSWRGRMGFERRQSPARCIDAVVIRQMRSTRSASGAAEGWSTQRELLIANAWSPTTLLLQKAGKFARKTLNQLTTAPCVDIKSQIQLPYDLHEASDSASPIARGPAANRSLLGIEIEFE